MTFLTDADVRAIGRVLGQHFTEGQLNEVGDLLAHAAQGCDYAAEDYNERADFERKHGGGEEDEYADAANSYGETSARLGALCAAIREGERIGR